MTWGCNMGNFSENILKTWNLAVPRRRTCGTRMWSRSMRSDGGCHNIPATFTNTLPRLTNPPILRFQELDAINCGEDDGDDVDLQLWWWWKWWWWCGFVAVVKVSNPELEIPAVFSLGDKLSQRTCAPSQQNTFALLQGNSFVKQRNRMENSAALRSMTCRFLHSSIRFHPNSPNCVSLRRL